MSRQCIKTIKNGCPNCGRDSKEVSHNDNYGMTQVLETHCNFCRWAIGPEGEIRNEGFKNREGKNTRRGKER